MLGPRGRAGRGGIAFEQIDRLAQLLRDRLGRQQPHPCRGQLDGQRHAVDGRHDRDHRLEMARQREAALRDQCARLEQLHGIEGAGGFEIPAVFVGHGQARERQRPFGTHAQARTRSHQQHQRGRRGEQVLDPGRQRRQMFGVVQHAAQAPLTQMAADALQRIARIGDRHLEPLRQSRRHRLGVGEVLQFDPDSGADVFRIEAPQRLRRQSALADAAGTDDRHQPAIGPGELHRQLGELEAPADEAALFDRAVDDADRWRYGRRRRCRLSAEQVAQPVRGLDTEFVGHAQRIVAEQALRSRRVAERNLGPQPRAHGVLVERVELQHALRHVDALRRRRCRLERGLCGLMPACIDPCTLRAQPLAQRGVVGIVDALEHAAAAAADGVERPPLLQCLFENLQVGGHVPAQCLLRHLEALHPGQRAGLEDHMTQVAPRVGIGPLGPKQRRKLVARDPFTRAQRQHREQLKAALGCERQCSRREQLRRAEHPHRRRDLLARLCRGHHRAPAAGLAPDPCCGPALAPVHDCAPRRRAPRHDARAAHNWQSPDALGSAAWLDLA